MKNFMWIFKHYFKRNFFNLSNYLLIGLPLIFTAAFTLTANFVAGLETDGDATPFVTLFLGMTVPIGIGFTFFGADLTTGWLHEDLKGPTGSRLRASGIDERIFYLGVISASWLFNLVMAGVFVAITSLVPFFGTDWHNYIFVAIAVALVVMVVQLLGVLIFYFTKDKKTAGKVGYVFGEIMIGIAMLPMFVESFNLPTVVQRIFEFFPVGVAVNAIESTSFALALPYFGILLAMVGVMAVVVIIVGRSKGHDRI